MKYKDEDPDNLDGLDEELPTEYLKHINLLLERLHQADIRQHGSIVFNIYGKGSNHVDHVENQNFYGGFTPRSAEGRLQGKNPSPKGEGDLKGREKGMVDLPEALSTDEAMALWEKAQAAGWIDADYQPLISRTQSALLANAMAERLGIREKWKVFEMLWNRRNMYRDFHDALDQRQSLDFQDKLKGLFC